MSIAQKCKIDGCISNFDHLRRGYCQKHYDSLKKYGDPLATTRHREDHERNRPTGCKVDGCKRSGHTRQDGEQYFVKGYCRTHYTRMYKHNNLTSSRRVKNGISTHPLVSTYYGMHARCYDKSHKSYPNYGGRGIGVCERWHFMKNFIEDMGERPEGMTLDRVDYNGNYEPSNCRWATPKEQANNTRGNNNLTIDGVTMTVTEWSKYSDVTRGQIGRRVKAGWCHEEAVFGSRLRRRWR